MPYSSGFFSSGSSRVATGPPDSCERGSGVGPFFCSSSGLERSPSASFKSFDKKLSSSRWLQQLRRGTGGNRITIAFPSLSILFVEVSSCLHPSSYIRPGNVTLPGLSPGSVTLLVLLQGGLASALSFSPLSSEKLPSSHVMFPPSSPCFFPCRG